MKNRTGTSTPECVFFVLKKIQIFKDDSQHESKSIRQTPLRKLPHREAQERGSRDLQERAPQTAARLTNPQDHAPITRS